MVKKSVSVKKEKPTLGQVVMVYTKSSAHFSALVEAEIVTIEDIKFIRGIQVTGKEWHRLERKRTLIPFEQISSIIEFACEEDLFSEPQPKHIRLPEEDKAYTPLTSHGQLSESKPQHNGRPHNRNRPNHNRHRHNGNRGGFNGRNDFNRGNRDPNRDPNS